MPKIREPKNSRHLIPLKRSRSILRPPTPQPRRAITVGQLAELLNVSARGVHYAVVTGRVPVVTVEGAGRHGRLYFVLEEDVPDIVETTSFRAYGSRRRGGNSPKERTSATT
jgi:hypothetical protein